MRITAISGANNRSEGYEQAQSAAVHVHPHLGVHMRRRLERLGEPRDRSCKHAHRLRAARLRACVLRGCGRGCAAAWMRVAGAPLSLSPSSGTPLSCAPNRACRQRRAQHSHTAQRCGAALPQSTNRTARGLSPNGLSRSGPEHAARAAAAAGAGVCRAGLPAVRSRGRASRACSPVIPQSCST